jgi:hypothetical protein
MDPGRRMLACSDGRCEPADERWSRVLNRSDEDVIAAMTHHR